MTTPMDALVPILEGTISPTKEVRDEAEQYLQQSAQTNLPAFLHALASVLADVGRSTVARTAAGLQLKNYLSSKNPDTKRQQIIRWLQIDSAIREQVKTLAVSALGTESSTTSSAAQCVAYLAAAELPNQQWNDVIPLLLSNVTNPQSTVPLKQATLEAIGYICEEIDTRFLATYTNEILTAIIQGMRKEEPNNRVRLAASRALMNALELTRANFEKQTERHYIMQVLCEGTQCEDTEVKVSALQNLVRVMSLYYQYMEEYMGPALFAITLEAMKSDNDNVALQGVEFWSTVCDEEQDLAIEAAEAQEVGRPAEHTSKFYIKGALGYLVPVLLVMLAKQEEFDDEEDWTPCKAAGVCLMLMANTAEDAVVPFILPFVTEHIKNADWKYRDAAVYAFGAMLEGPEPASLVPYIGQAIETLLRLMDDESVQVKDTTAWVIGRICEHVPSAVLTDQFIIPLLNTLVNGLAAEPRVATNVCWAISSLAEAAYDSVDIPDDAIDDQPDTYCLSPLYSALMSKVLDATQRADGGQNNLRTAAYEALMSLIKHSAKDCYQVICETTNIVMGRLQQAVQLDSQVSSNERSQLSELQSLLCAALQSLVRKLSRQDALLLSDTVVSTLLQMLGTSTGRTGGVQEDALMTAGALIEVIDNEFLKYMDNFKPYLLAGLKNKAEYQVCHAAVGLVGDLSRSLQAAIAPYTDDIMTVLMEDLQDPDLNRAVKTFILSTFGDIAIAIGANFKKHLVPVLNLLQQASQYQVDKMDYDLVDYLNELRDGCLEAYTGIVQGLRGPDSKNYNPDVQLIGPHVPFIVAFIGFIGVDDDHTDSNVAIAAGLLGDLFATFGKAMLEVLNNQPGVMKLLNEGKQSRSQRTKTMSLWALKELKKLNTT